MRWEYFWADGSNLKSLDVLGQEGWEAIGIYTEEDRDGFKTPIVLMKKPINERVARIDEVKE